VSLTSTWFQVVTIVLAVVVAVAPFVLWNRLPGPPVAKFFARVGLVVVGEGLTALAVLVSLNIAFGGLIVSWSDLLGSESTHGGSFAGQPGQWRSHLATGRAAAAGSLRPPTGHQRFVSVGEGFGKTTLTGAESGITSQVYVATPPEYASHPHEYFPVLELFPGVPGSPEGWVRPMNVVKHLAAAVATGKAHPYILVVPTITPIVGRDGPWDNEECSDVPGDANVDTWLTVDVRNLVLHNFRAIGSASGWAAMGYSTGGFCAAKVVLSHPDRYQAAVSLSGYYIPMSKLLTGDRPLARANSPQWTIEHTRTPPVSLLMTASRQDKIDPPSEAEQMLAAARSNPRSRATEVQSFIVPQGGGHNQAAWEKMLPIAFTWLSARVAGPTT
jgi:enterochelin esterase-like enzyme